MKIGTQFDEKFINFQNKSCAESLGFWVVTCCEILKGKARTLMLFLRKNQLGFFGAHNCNILANSKESNFEIVLYPCIFSITYYIVVIV